MSDKAVLAVDFGGTKVESALVRENGTLISDTRHRAPTGRDASTNDLESSVRQVVEDGLGHLHTDTELIGVGIGSAGPVNRAYGLITPINVVNWRDYPLRDFVAGIMAEHEYDIPVELETDGIAITMAEHWVGAAHNINNVMGMVVSTGIGGGIISGGRILTGASGNAGHIGQIDVAGMTGVNTYGHFSSLEAVASGPHTVAWAQSEGFAGISGEELAASYRAGDPIAQAAVIRCGTAIGQAICSTASILDLELVTIGGGFSQVTPDLFEVINDTVAHHYLAFVRKVQVVPSALSGEGPLIGAGALLHRGGLLP